MLKCFIAGESEGRREEGTGRESEFKGYVVREGGLVREGRRVSEGGREG